MLENKAEFISSLIFGIIVLLAIGFISGCAVSALILNDDHLSLIMQLRKPKKGSAEQTSPTVNMLESDILDNAEEGTYIAVDNGVYDKLGKNRPHAPKHEYGQESDICIYDVVENFPKFEWPFHCF